MARLIVLRELRSGMGKELYPPLHFGDATQSALMPSILDKAFRGDCLPQARYAFAADLPLQDASRWEGELRI